MVSQIDRITNLSFTEFEDKYIKNQIPVIINDNMSNWKALKTWSPEYFAKVLGNKDIKVGVSRGNTFSYEKKHTGSSVKFKAMKMGDLVNKILLPNPNRKLKYYLIHEPIEEKYPELINDYTIPLFGKKNHTFTSINLWFGEANNITPLHFDIQHNFLAQIFGRKYLRLYSPEDSNYLYPTYNRIAGNPNYRANHSNIVNIYNPDSKAFPEFKKALPIDVYLEPGEILFLPAGWWHQVSSLDTSISLNFWWKPKLDEINLTHLLKYRLRGLYLNNEFHIVRRWLDLSNFSSYLDISNYLMQKNNKWISILFIGAYIRDRKTNTNIQGSFLNTYNKSIERYGSIDKLVKLAFKEDDSLLKNTNLKQLIDSLKL